jgi:hypothetical protein
MADAFVFQVEEIAQACQVAYDLGWTGSNGTAGVSSMEMERVLWASYEYERGGALARIEKLIIARGVEVAALRDEAEELMERIAALKEECREILDLDRIRDWVRLLLSALEDSQPLRVARAYEGVKTWLDAGADDDVDDGWK